MLSSKPLEESVEGTVNGNLQRHPTPPQFQEQPRDWTLASHGVCRTGRWQGSFSRPSVAGPGFRRVYCFGFPRPLVAVRVTRRFTKKDDYAI